MKTNMIRISVVFVIFCNVYAKMKYEALPKELHTCFNEMYTKKGKYLPAETIASTCLSRYTWKYVAVRCEDPPKQTLDFIGEMLLPCFKNTKYHKKRKEYRTLTDYERNSFHAALNALKKDTTVKPNKYDAIAGYHSALVGSAAHSGPAFLPWHRIYLQILENALQSKIPTVTLPYWDCSLDDNMDDYAAHESTMWHADFMGEVSKQGTLQNGPMVNWNITRNLGMSGSFLFTEARIKHVMNITNYLDFCYFTEIFHNEVHNWVGGRMSLLEEAPRDPTFFLFHCFVDYLWWEWQSKNYEKPFTWTYPNFTGLHAPNATILGLKIDNRTIKNAEGIQKTWYHSVIYERRPSCKGFGNTCSNSKYLRCIKNNTLCASKYKLHVPPSQKHDMPGIISQIDSFVHHSSLKQINPINVEVAQPFTAPLAADIKIPNIPDLIAKISQPQFDFESIFNLAEEKLVPKQCYGFSIQNEFTINCKSDSKLWAFLPVKVVHLRQSNTIFHSHLVSKGNVDHMSDMYNENNYRKAQKVLKPGKPLTYEKCISNNAGIFKVIVSSQGLNYRGTFKEYVLLDNRQAVDGKVGYIAFKRPDTGVSKFMLTAFDECGRVCAPKCRKAGTHPAKYVPCSGVLTIDKAKPSQYYNTYGEAVLQYWKYSHDDVCPLARDDAVDIVFFCDYKTKWYPWI